MMAVIAGATGNPGQYRRDALQQLPESLRVQQGGELPAGHVC